MASTGLVITLTVFESSSEHIRFNPDRKESNYDNRHTTRTRKCPNKPNRKNKKKKNEKKNPEVLFPRLKTGTSGKLYAFFLFGFVAFVFPACVF